VVLGESEKPLRLGFFLWTAGNIPAWGSRGPLQVELLALPARRKGRQGFTDPTTISITCWFSLSLVLQSQSLWNEIRFHSFHRIKGALAAPSRASPQEALQPYKKITTLKDSFPEEKAFVNRKEGVGAWGAWGAHHSIHHTQ